MTGIPEQALTDLRFDFGAPVSVVAGFLLVAVLAVVTLCMYWPRLRRLSRASRVLVVLLRSVIVALTVFMLLDPCIVKVLISPGENFVLLLFDDSKSMQVAGENGLTRGVQLQNTYATAGADMEKELSQKFQLLRYRLGDSAERIRDPQDLSFSQSESDIVGSIENALREMSDSAVSAVVLFSDGAQQPPVPDIAAKHFPVPIVTVGTDTGGAWRDLALDRLSLQRTNADGSPVAVTGTVSAEGLSGEKAIFEVLEGDQVVASTELQIPEGSASQEVRVEFVPKGKRWLSYNARIRLAKNKAETNATTEDPVFSTGLDRVRLNNSRDFAVDNREKVFRILYFCGGPTWENKFFRRALGDDDQLKLTSLIRVSRAEKTWTFRGKKSSLSNPLFVGSDEETFDQPRYDEAVVLRLGVEKSELTTGYPEHAEELFPFHLVIWGDIEYDFFSMAQLEVTRDFVQKRGGSFLMLGGPRSFAEGGYAGTLIDDMLPVVLGDADSGTRKIASQIPFSVKPTTEGLIDNIWALDPEPGKNQEQWQGMKNLYGLNAFPLTRAGASVMARVIVPDHLLGDRGAMNEQAFYVAQKYGRGKTAVLATGETWPWQMNEPVEDQRHERLWRQLVRELVTTVPEAVALKEKLDNYPVGKTYRVATVLRDGLFEEREGLRVSADILRPSGGSQSVSVDESIRETGLYEAEFFPEEPGMHLFRFEALDDNDEVVGTLEEALMVEPDLREFQSAQYDEGFLKTLAKNSGGSHFTLGELDKVAGSIPWEPMETEETTRYHLWHFPPFFFLLAAMLALEWFVRRRKGCA